MQITKEAGKVKLELVAEDSKFRSRKFLLILLVVCLSTWNAHVKIFTGEHLFRIYVLAVSLYSGANLLTKYESVIKEFITLRIQTNKTNSPKEST